MIIKYLLTISFVLITNLISFGHNSAVNLSEVTEKISKEITQFLTTEKKIDSPTKDTTNELTLKAALWPNPSNIGKVRLSVENLPKARLFIQIFNDKSELIQDGEIYGPKGASFHHILNLPDTSGTYSIKLSNATKILKDLELEIL